mgnify:CR=1 FL=1
MHASSEELSLRHLEHAFDLDETDPCTHSTRPFPILSLTEHEVSSIRRIVFQRSLWTLGGDSYIVVSRYFFLHSLFCCRAC